MPFQIIPYFFTSKAFCIECKTMLKWSFFSSPCFHRLCGKQESKDLMQMGSVTT